MSNLVPFTDVRKVWTPLPGSQTIALDSRAQETLYTGTRGPGKTDTQLMRFRRRVGVGYGTFWRGIILDREYKNLDDLIVKSKRWFKQFNDGAEFLSSTAAYKWVWPSGEELLFRTAKKEDDYWDFHGQEFPFIGWNELTKYPTGKLYAMFMSCNRSSFTPEKDAPKDAEGKPTLPPIPLEIFSTTNPWGAGHGWVKSEFIDPAPYGRMVRKTLRVFDPQTQEERDIERTRVAIFGTYKENKYLDALYIASLEAEKDENLRKAWLEGDWNVAAGGALSDLWKANIHVKQRFVVPSNWYKDRTFDWGSSHPFWVGMWAEAAGEEVAITHPDGHIEMFCPPKGSLILFDEIYGTHSIGTNEGVRWSAKRIATAVKDRIRDLLEQGWITGKVAPGPADNQIFNSNQSDEETIAKKMALEKVEWTRSDKSKGSRVNGLQLVRDRLEAAILHAQTGESAGPGLYVMVHCRASIGIVPSLPRDPDNPDDVDTDAEDHPYDGWRYRCLASVKKAAKSLNVGFARAR